MGLTVRHNPLIRLLQIGKYYIGSERTKFRDMSHMPRMFRVLHELGGLLKTTNATFSLDLVPAESMAGVLSKLDKGHITGTTAKRLLSKVFDGDKRSVDAIIEDENLRLEPLSKDEYLAMAQTLIDENETRVKQIQQKRQLGKLQYLVGQMMRRGEGKVEAIKAEKVLKEILGLD